MQRKEKTNNPVFECMTWLAVERLDNTVEFCQHIADAKDDRGNQIQIGYVVSGEQLNLCVTVTDESNSRKMYVVGLTEIADKIAANDKPWRTEAPHLRPVTSADAEVAVEDPLPEPTEEELLAAQATTPPPIQHKHDWVTDPKSHGLIDVCSTCGEMRA